MVGRRFFSHSISFIVISFLLFITLFHHSCSCPEDKHLVVSCHWSAAPVLFTKELESQAVDEGDDVSLHCQLSRSAVALEWKKGELGLCPCAKYDIKQAGALAMLVIRDVDPGDSGSYTCDTGDCRSTAHLVVKGTLAYSLMAFFG